MNLPANFNAVPGEPIFVVGANRLCLIPAAAAATGYTPKAIRRKIEEGVWVEGKHWRRAPDKRIFINLAAVTKWIEGEAA